MVTPVALRIIALVTTFVLGTVLGTFAEQVVLTRNLNERTKQAYVTGCMTVVNSVAEEFKIEPFPDAAARCEQVGRLQGVYR